MNEWRLAEALASFRRLTAVLSQMTEEEIARAIALEQESLRRKSILERLFAESRKRALAAHEASLQQAITQEK